MDETLAERTYRAVRSAIGTGLLRGGEKITERGLAERFEVSPTPVREAIRRLEQDGLIQRTGPRTVELTETPGANKSTEVRPTLLQQAGLSSRSEAPTQMMFSASLLHG